MARIRTIKPDFFRHEALYEAERACGLPLRLAFAGLWTAADREGRFRWKPRTLKLDCLPYDDVDFEAVLNALAAHGFIVKYQSEEGGDELGYIPSWSTHQHVNQREAQSTLPAPTGAHQVHAHASTCTHIDARGEGKGKEGKGTDIDARTCEHVEREPWLRLAKGVVDAFEAANIPVLPDTARTQIWIAQGFDPSICLAVVRETLSRARGRVISNLAYFDNPIREAHAQRAPERKPAPSIDWPHWFEMFKLHQTWPEFLGPSPDVAGCRAPLELLRRHGYLQEGAA